MNSSTTYISTLEVDPTERAVTVELAQAIAGELALELYPTERMGVFEVRIGDRRFPVVIQSNGVEEVSVDLRGYRYTGKVLGDRHHRLLSILRASPAMQARVVKVTSPMPGMIKEVLVTEGEEITKGTPLFTLEAMKMENAIAAPMSGIVQQLSAANGKAVEKGALLCVIEPAG